MSVAVPAGSSWLDNFAAPSERVNGERAQGGEGRVGRLRRSAGPAARLVDAQSPAAKREAVVEANRVLSRARVGELCKGEAAVAGAGRIHGEANVALQWSDLARREG